jgi:hypothetical protein
MQHFWSVYQSIDKWHKCNPVKPISSSLMYKINPVATSSQTSVATNMVLTSSTNAFTADQRIAALEQEIFYLRNAKRTFDGVEILEPTRANKTNPTEQPKVPESTTKPAPPPSQPAPVEKPTTQLSLQSTHLPTSRRCPTDPLTSTTLPPPLPNQSRTRSQHITM